MGLGLLAAPCAATLAAEVTVGAGLRTSFAVADPDGGESSSAFSINSARIYFGGTVTDQIGFMFNTEYNGEEIYVMDAAAKFTFSDSFNLMAGRFLAPSDRANLYGPYYGSNWGFATDGVQDGYPFVEAGRSDGAMYWGQFGVAKLALGVFNNELQSASIGGDLKYAGRLQFDFWDSESGYYLNGSYYGAKDLLALGVAVQGSGDASAYTVDALLEKKLAGGGVVTLEGEYAKYDGYGYYPGFTDGDGYYVLAGYLFPQVVGVGKFQVLAKYGTAKIDEDDGEGGDFTTSVDTLELNLNYIIKDQNARVHLFYIDSDGAAKVYGLGLQIQM
ncbi:MAG: hypothetical protein ABIP38_00105 [Steroidobacteraceae bacterium]